MSKKADENENEDKKAKKGKKGKGKVDASAGPSVAAHPRASRQVRKAKGWGGLAGFAIAAYLSHKAGVPTVDLGLRAIIAGIVGYLLAWACAVTIWRHLVLAELRALADREPAHNPDFIPARATADHPAPAAEAAAAPSAAPAAS